MQRSRFVHRNDASARIKASAVIRPSTPPTNAENEAQQLPGGWQSDRQIPSRLDHMNTG